MKDISGPSISRDTIEVTDRDVSNNYKLFWGGYSDGGDLTFDINWDPNDLTHGTASGTCNSQGTALLADFENQNNCTQPSWQTITDLCGGTATWTFDGPLTGFDFSLPEQGAVTASVTVKVSGRPVLVVK